MKVGDPCKYSKVSHVFCPGHYKKTGKIDLNDLHPSIMFFYMECDVCGDESYSEPYEKPKFNRYTKILGYYP